MLHIAEAIILQAPGTEVVFLPLEAEVYARGSAVGDIPRMLVSTSTLESAQQIRWVSQVTLNCPPMMAIAPSKPTSGSG